MIHIQGRIGRMMDYFPFFGFEKGCLLSKQGEISACYRVQLPEIFSLTDKEYESLNYLWQRAIKVLPPNSILHKQDWFYVKAFTPDFEREHSQLSHANARHFNEREHVHHECFLYLTKTTRKRITGNSLMSVLGRKHLIPEDITDVEIDKWLDTCRLFERVINDSGLIEIIPLNEVELLGNENHLGLIERYINISDENRRGLNGINLDPEKFSVGDNRVLFYSLTSTAHLPSSVKTHLRSESYSTDKSECNLSFSAPVAINLAMNHIYNQYVFVDDSDQNLKRFEGIARNMHSLVNFSRKNAINEDYIHEYLNEAHSKGLRSVRAAFNVMVWGSESQLESEQTEVYSAFSQMGCDPKNSPIDRPVLFWSGIPGNGADYPAEETFYTFTPQAVSFFSGETHYANSLSGFGIKMVDRNGLPIHLDISDLPMKKGIIQNRNKFILGPSGSGKSYFTNHLVRQYYEQGAHVVIVDMGNSYLGQCRLINEETGGKDGIYYTYTEEHPISFNPFYNEEGGFDINRRNSLLALLMTLWKGEKLPTKTEESELDTALSNYIRRITSGEEPYPSFNGFYEYLRDSYRHEMENADIRVKTEDFDIDNFLITLKRFYQGGTYDFLLNSSENIDLLSKRFVVFEIDTIKDDPNLFPVVTVIIMSSFIQKVYKLNGIRKVILIEEAWKALATANMAGYVQYLYKTIRKYFGEAIVVTQEIDDIISSPIVKDAILNNSDCKILLDQRKYMNKFEKIQELLGLTDKEKGQILSINMNLDPKRKYKEVWIGLGGQRSAVYGTEVSVMEHYAYTTEQTEKMELLNEVNRNGGSFRRALKTIYNNKMMEDKE